MNGATAMYEFQKKYGFGNFVETTKKLALEILQYGDHYSDFRGFHAPDHEWNLILWLIEHEVIEPSELANVVDLGICAQGISVYEYHMRPYGPPPDHAGSPIMLGYVIRHGILTEEQISGITFNHEQTPAYWGHQAAGLLGKVIQQILDGLKQKGIIDDRKKVPVNEHLCEGCHTDHS